MAESRHRESAANRDFEGLGYSAKVGLLAAEVAQLDVELLWKLLENQPGTEITPARPGRRSRRSACATG